MALCNSGIFTCDVVLLVGWWCFEMRQISRVLDLVSAQCPVLLLGGQSAQLVWNLLCTPISGKEVCMYSTCLKKVVFRAAVGSFFLSCTYWCMLLFTYQLLWYCACKRSPQSFKASMTTPANAWAASYCQMQASTAELHQENPPLLPFCNVDKLESVSFSSSSKNLRLRECTNLRRSSDLGEDLLLYKIWGKIFRF